MKGILSFIADLFTNDIQDWLTGQFGFSGLWLGVTTGFISALAALMVAVVIGFCIMVGLAFFDDNKSPDGSDTNQNP